MLRKLSNECSKCQFKDTCDHKRMEAMCYLEPVAMPIVEPCIMPAMRETVDVYVPGVGKVTMYKDELEKQLHKGLCINTEFLSGS
ncbi:MAG: hypothetical protein PHC62_03955 [Candidatus Izemoplasmatales bacterium]|nr:hypothetical protein [Candidatus Izemoplasmatales bacterium]